MQTNSITCPQCGGSVEVANRYAKYVACPWCGAVSSLEPGNNVILGQFPKLADLPALLSPGIEGTIRGRRFRTIGRIRYRHDSGFWDEWLILFEDGQSAWFVEDEGEYLVLFPVRFQDAPPEWETVRVGQKITVNGVLISILEKGEAELAGAEGELPWLALPGQRIRFLDGVASGKQYSIEATENEIELFVGEALERHEVRLDPAAAS
jgi:hypothetical protein